jgi:hypothetical protein
MAEAQVTSLVQQEPGPVALAAPAGSLAAVADIERAVERQMEPLLHRAKQITLEVIDEVAQKHGNPLVAQLRQALLETVGTLIRTEAAALVDRLRPALLDSTAVARQNADVLLADLRKLINETVVEVFRVHVPEYSRWVGQRVIDYLLAGTLFCLTAVLVCVGVILGLEKAGVPGYATYLVSGGVALAVGVALLKLRSRHWAKVGEGSGQTTPGVK